MWRKAIIMGLCVMLVLTASCAKSQANISGGDSGTSSVVDTPSSSAETTITTEMPFVTFTNTSAKYYIQSYTLTDTSHQGSTVIIRYPQLVSAGSDKVNGVIKTKATKIASDYYGSDYANLSLDVDYHLTFNNDDWLSISFNGSGNVKTAAHPNDILQTMNINLKDGYEIKLTDIYNVNADFVRVFRNEFSSQVKTRLAVIMGFSPADTDSAASYLDQYDDQTLTKYLSNSYCYMTNDKIGISFEMPHAIGDHFETEIPYSDLLKDLKMKVAPFQ